MLSTRVRILLGLLVALALVGGTYTGLATLREDADAADDAATRLIEVRLDMVQMLDIPWGASPAETDDPQAVADEMLGAEQGVRAELDALDRSPGLPEREEFLQHFNMSVEALQAILAAVAAEDDESTGRPSMVSARQMYQADAVLQRATRRLQRDADRSAHQESVGSLVLVGCLFVAFGIYFVRSARSRAKLASAVDELALARDAALVAAQQKAAFLATMSHEIRTPLNGLVGLNDLLLRTGLDTYQQQLVNGADVSGRTLLRLVNDVLDLSKIEAGHLVLESIDFDLRKLLDDIAVVLGIQARHKGVELVVSCHPDVPDRLRGDPTRLGQVIYNLTSNALKFTSAGEVSVRALAYDHVTRQAILRVEVNDTGPGVDPDKREHIFEPYSQAEASTTRKYGGTGLGLAIARQIVEAMGGTIGVEDGPQRGAQFWFTVPLVRAQPVAASATGAGAELLSGRRVLVVGDNATSRMVLCELLGRWHAVARAASGGAAAIGLLEASVAAGEPFDAVLVDSVMPDLGGAELVARIQAHEALSGVAILVLSAAPDPLPGEPVAPDAVAMLAKPVPAEVLLEALSRVLAPAEPGAAPAAAAEAAEAADAADAGRGRVLVVDDNDVNRLVASGMLASLGYEPVEASDGLAALAALEDAGPGGFAAVLMDVHMPRMDGYDATRALRVREGGRSRVPVLALTATTAPSERSSCLEAGMDDFLTKPLGVAELRAALDHWVRADGGSSASEQAPQPV